MNDKTAAEDQTEYDSDDMSEEAEKAALKQRAQQIGLKVSPNIGLDTLRKKVNAALTGANDETDETDEDAGEGETAAKKVEEPKEENLTPQQAKARRRKAARDEKLRLIRIRYTNMNPQKKDIPGEYFSFGNELLGSVRRFVPYGDAAENGWHVEKVILDQMRERKFLSITTKPNKEKPGQIDVKTKWVPEFAIEVLEPLTEKELKELARRQAAAQGIDPDE